LAILFQIVNAKDHIQITRWNIGDFHIIEGLKELVQGEAATILSIENLELAL